MLIGFIITNICFLGVAFVTNEDNAEQLLSGYNTMSKKEQESLIQITGMKLSEIMKKSERFG